MLALSLAFTSCDELIGELDNLAPSPVTPTPEPIVSVTAITLDNALRFNKNDLTPQTITATITPSDATDKTITWTSSDENVATVDATGKVTLKSPVSAGEVATITAKAGDKTAECTVYVYDEIYSISSGSPVLAANGYYLINGDGTSVDYPISIPDGATVTLNGISISSGIVCVGTATIILADGSENTVESAYNAGITAGGAGTLLTIRGEKLDDGKLTAKGAIESAGIGASNTSACGDIVIEGGNITAIGRYDAAGIGSGSYYGCGNITINGGTVTAQGDNGAGIGTGEAYNCNNTCGNITINGGTVTALGGSGGAGIGTGLSYITSGEASKQTCGNILISGGTVIAQGGKMAAGIGTGEAYQTGAETPYQVCGTITIETGVTSVTATKGEDSPNSIGVGGIWGYGSHTCGTITIGGEVKTQDTFTGDTFTYPVAP